MQRVLGRCVRNTLCAGARRASATAAAKLGTQATSPRSSRPMQGKAPAAACPVVGLSYEEAVERFQATIPRMGALAGHIHATKHEQP
jgi:hypothetical protein